MNTVECERNDDRSLKEVEKKSEDELDHFLEYGKYQALRVWIFGILLGTCTKISMTLRHFTWKTFCVRIYIFHLLMS